MKSRVEARQTIRMDQADVLIVANKLAADPYSKFHVVAPDGKAMFVLISLQALEIIERVFRRLIRESDKVSPETVAGEALRQLECLEAGKAERLEIASARGASSGG